MITKEINILKDLQVEKRQDKNLFIKIIFGEDENLEYDLVSKVVLKKIDQFLLLQKESPDLTGNGVLYVEFYDDYISLSGNWDAEGDERNFTVMASLSGDLFDYEL
jgi:hypothetical protein